MKKLQAFKQNMRKKLFSNKGHRQTGRNEDEPFEKCVFYLAVKHVNSVRLTEWDKGTTGTHGPHSICSTFFGGGWVWRREAQAAR